MATNSSKYKLTGVNGSEIQISLNGPTGPTGPANVLNIGNVTTAETGVPAAASITGSSPSQLLHLTLPKGNTGTAATIAVGATTTGEAGSSASVTNGGSSSAAVFNFTIPKGDKGNTGTLSLGTVATGNAGTDVIITNTGTPEAGEFNFTIPRGNTGLTGPANQLSVNPTVTGAAGTDASVVISGTAPSQTLSFTIPRGNTGLTGPTGPANQLSVNPTVTGAAGTDASVVISGTAPSQTLSFTIPRGDTGATGSSGAVSLLTGFASAAGTVAETDTILAAVGKLDGNIALRATTASLYPYIGGKLLTYLDEEAAIDDPLISAGDIYRKSAGGVDYVNPDNVPSLDLRFATDKTLTARRGPTPTFTRGSGATYIGSDGLIHGIDTSTTSNSISAASKTFTLDATAGQDQFWRTGDAVEASNGSNIMAGTVTSYDPATQSLVCNMTTASGTGTFTSWRIGYRGPRFDHDPVSRTNLFQYSEIFNEAASSNYWDSATANAVTSNQTTSPDGAATADLLTTSTTSFDCFVRRTINWVGSTQYSYSIFLKRGPSNHRYVGLYIGAGITGALHYPYFDFDNPTTVQIPSGTMVGTINSTRVNAYPNGWYRVSVTFTTAATPVTIYGGVYVSTSNGTLSSTPTAGLDCYIWGIQAETGAFPTSYIPTTTAPVTIRDCRGLLIEEGRTNLILQSENFASASWIKSNSSISGTLYTAPTGASTANELIEDSLNATHTCVQNASAATIGTTYTFSVFVKRKPSSNQFLLIGATNLVAASFLSVNLTNGVTSTGIGSPGVPINVSSTAYPDGWYRVQFSVVATSAAATTLDIRLSRDGTWANRSYLGDGVQSSLIWGAQVEAGSFPTSYIPTTTGTLARGADVCNITGGGFNNFYNQSEGTMLANSSSFAPQPLALPSRRVVTASDGTSGNRVAIGNIAAGFIASGLSQALIVVTGGSPQSDIGIAGLTLSSLNKTAAAYKGNDFAVSTNSSAVVTDVIGSVPTNLNRLEIGNQLNNDFLCGHIASIRYYKKRLPNAKLVTLTT